jgi:hypothetical protein
MKYILYSLSILGLWKIYDLACLYYVISIMKGGL